MTWTLGIDCSSVELGLGLCSGDGFVAALSRYVANSHAEQISPGVGALLETSGVAAHEIERIGVAVGPGSFTGLRIAIAFVKGFALERDVKILSLSSLQTLACAWGPSDGDLVVAFDARRDEVFWNRFRGDALQRSSDGADRRDSREEFIAALRDGDTIVTDTVGYTRSSVFADIVDRPRVCAVERHPVQRGLSCARLAARESSDSTRWVSAREVQPIYLRLAYAEERRQHASANSR